MCPLNLIVPIPSRNKQLWSCVAHMFQKTLNPKERLFWTRYLGNYKYYNYLYKTHIKIFRDYVNL